MSNEGMVPSLIEPLRGIKAYAPIFTMSHLRRTDSARLAHLPGLRNPLEGVDLPGLWSCREGELEALPPM
jgi:hypothetical protein